MENGTKIIGRICKKHPEFNGLRSAISGYCIACNREAGARYYEANKEKIRAKHREYARINIEKNTSRALAWAKKNKDRHAKNAANWRAKNPERSLSFTANWVKRNLHICAEREAKKRALNKRATPLWANDFFIKEAYHLAKLREKICGGEWHVDHIVPLKSKLVCGLHVEHNLRVILGKENCSKGNRVWPDMPQ